MRHFSTFLNQVQVEKSCEISQLFSTQSRLRKVEQTQRILSEWGQGGARLARCLREKNGTTASSSFAPFYSIQLYSSLFYFTLCHSTFLYACLLCFALFYSTLPYSTLLYSTLLLPILQFYSILLYSTTAATATLTPTTTNATTTTTTTLLLLVLGIAPMDKCRVDNCPRSPQGNLPGSSDK